jgi:dTDP-4-dehydrorhamnose 3,5-epimerase
MKEKKMEFIKTKINGLMLIELKKIADNRGSFTRLFCKELFEKNNLNGDIVQQNLSTNKLKGTIRGLHSQKIPKAEVKMVRCITGGIFDVAVDLRVDSPTYLQWFGTELTDSNCKMLYIPEGFAHGYQTLTENASVEYLVTSTYEPTLEYGLRYDDPKIGVDWPLSVVSISAKDANWKFL